MALSHPEDRVSQHSYPFSGSPILLAFVSVKFPETWASATVTYVPFRDKHSTVTNSQHFGQYEPLY